MRRNIILLIQVILIMFGTAKIVSAETAYDFSFPAIDGTAVSLAEYKGKVVMVVNTASACGFTDQ